MKSPFNVVRDFEQAVAEYCGAPYAVAVTSCTMAIRLSLLYWKNLRNIFTFPYRIKMPKKTYVSVGYQILISGFQIEFTEEEWLGYYKLDPTNVVDSARLFTSSMYIPGTLMCTSHHWTKTLGLGQGGCILTDDAKAVEWFKKMRFDGRTEGVAPKDDNFEYLGAYPEHCYMSPRDAAEGLSRLAILPKHNDPLPNDDYPDLSKLKVFQ